MRVQLWWKRLTGNDTGNYTFTKSNINYWIAACALFSGRVKTGSPFSQFAADVNANSATVVNEINATAASLDDGGDVAAFMFDTLGGDFSGATEGYTISGSSWSERNNGERIGLWTKDDQLSGVPGTVTFTDPVASDIAVALGVLTEEPGGAAQTVIIGQAVEADAGQLATIHRAVQLGLAVEEETALPLAKVIEIGQAVEEDQGQETFPVPRVIIEIGQAVEQDDGFALGHARTLAIGQALEGDTGLAATPTQAKIIEIGQAVETDQGLPLTPSLTVEPRGISACEVVGSAMSSMPAVGATGVVPNTPHGPDHEDHTPVGPGNWLTVTGPATSRDFDGPAVC
jgi:hypothetical protein